MQVIELFGLTRWISRNIKQRTIPERYRALYKILAQNTQPNQPKVPFENERRDLVAALNETPLHQLTEKQLEVLTKFGIAANVGPNAGTEIEQLFRDLNLDLATLAVKVKERMEAVQEGLKKSELLYSALVMFKSEVSLDPVNGAILRVVFTDGAAIRHVVDLEDWAKRWSQIARGVTAIHGSTPEQVEVVTAETGSIMISFLLAVPVAISISKIVSGALTMTERVIKILQQVEVLRELKLKNKKLHLDLKKEIDEIKRDGITEIHQEIIKGHIAADGDGDVKAAAKLSVSHIVEFLQKGGQIDLLLPSIDESELPKAAAKQNQQLRETVEQIRKLEQSIKLLERHAPEVPDEGNA